MFVILDRDGVINHDSDAYIKSPAEWQPIDGSLTSIARLNAAGVPVTVATNQSGLGRGLFSAETLTAIHETMQHALAACGGFIDGIFFCPHAPADECTCRKPKPGLLQQIAEQFAITLDPSVYFIGDSWRDMQAAQAVGCQPVLVRTGKGEATLAAHAHELEGIHVYPDLCAVVDALLHG